MKILFWHRGDPSVGMRSDEATLEIEEFDDANIQEAVVEGIREVLEEAWDFETFAEDYKKIEEEQQAEFEAFVDWESGGIERELTNGE